MVKSKRILVYVPYLAVLAFVIGMSCCEASAGGTARTWPWDAFLLSLAQEFTGPLPTTLGILGIVGAALALMSGRYEFNKFFGIIFAVSIALFAPTLITWLTSDSGGSATGILLGGY